LNCCIELFLLISSQKMSAAGKYKDELIATAKAIASPGKGILAADESTGTIGQRFAKIKLENTEANRRAYRELLFTTPGNWGDFISGVIMYEETLYQKASDGKSFVQIIKEKGSIPGIKVDKGLEVLPGTDGESATMGLDGLGERCRKYYEQGARFAKWRAVIKISPSAPSALGIQEVAWGLARYAAICQTNGLCPIVEPEVLMDGDHTIERTAAVSERVLAAVYKALNDNNVLLEGSLLKPAMCVAGQDFKPPSTPQEIAHHTVTTLSRTVPPSVPGIMFLSGGQGEEEATVNLNAINKYPGKKPWHLSFSYGRALQATVIATWKGDANNVNAAQEVFLKRARYNSDAQLGKYVASGATDESLFEKDYKY